MLETAIGQPAATRSAGRCCSARSPTSSPTPATSPGVASWPTTRCRPPAPPATTALLLRVLNLVFFALWIPDTLDERLALTEESLRLVERVDDPLARYWAASANFLNLLQAGRLAEADPLLEESTRLADRLAQPALRWRALHTRGHAACLLAGDPDAAEPLAHAVVRGRRRRRRARGRRVLQVAADVPPVAAGHARRAERPHQGHDAAPAERGGVAVPHPLRGGPPRRRRGAARPRRRSTFADDAPRPAFIASARDVRRGRHPRRPRAGGGRALRPAPPVRRPDRLRRRDDRRRPRAPPRRPRPRARPTRTKRWSASSARAPATKPSAPASSKPAAATSSPKPRPPDR